MENNSWEKTPTNPKDINHKPSSSREERLVMLSLIFLTFFEVQFNCSVRRHRVRGARTIAYPLDWVNRLPVNGDRNMTEAPPDFARRAVGVPIPKETQKR